MDKKWGKAIKLNKMLLAIALFLYDGKKFRTDILDIVIPKLIELRESIHDVFLQFAILCLEQLEILVIKYPYYLRRL